MSVLTPLKGVKEVDHDEFCQALKSQTKLGFLSLDLEVFPGGSVARTGCLPDPLWRLCGFSATPPVKDPPWKRVRVHPRRSHLVRAEIAFPRHRPNQGNPQGRQLSG